MVALHRLLRDCSYCCCRARLYRSRCCGGRSRLMLLGKLCCCSSMGLDRETLGLRAAAICADATRERHAVQHVGDVRHQQTVGQLADVVAAERAILTKESVIEALQETRPHAVVIFSASGLRPLHAVAVSNALVLHVAEVIRDTDERPFQGLNVGARAHAGIGAGRIRHGVGDVRTTGAIQVKQPYCRSTRASGGDDRPRDVRVTAVDTVGRTAPRCLPASDCVARRQRGRLRARDDEVPGRFSRGAGLALHRADGSRERPGPSTCDQT